MQKIWIIGFFFECRLHWQFKVEKILQTAIFRLHMYLHTNKTLIHLEFGNFLSNLGTPLAVTVSNMFLCLNLSTVPDLKFQTAITIHSTLLNLITGNFKAN
jgi:hypothetical protein